MAKRKHQTKRTAPREPSQPTHDSFPLWGYLLYGGVISLFVVAGILYVRSLRTHAQTVLEEQVHQVEQRVLNETLFGTQIRDDLKRKETRYILDPNLPYQARYSIVDDSIHYNPKLDPSLEKVKKELLRGRSLKTILNFHEELHRSQVSFSKRGAFFRFFRENGQIQERLLPNGKARYEFTLNLARGDEGKILNFAGALAGYPILDLQTAGEMVRQKMDEMNAPHREQSLLEEIHAYLGSDIIIAEGIYTQLYETHGETYENLPKIEFSDFSSLCDLMIQLYGFYNGNHDAVCKVVGESQSLSDFQKRAQSLLGNLSSEALNQRVEKWILLKKEWARGTIQIAKEVLKEDK